MPLFQISTVDGQRMTVEIDTDSAAEVAERLKGGNALEGTEVTEMPSGDIRKRRIAILAGAIVAVRLA
jgi:hypothetical protein